jgi:hypothetical protein
MLTWLARVAPGTASSLLRSPGSAAADPMYWPLALMVGGLPELR